MKTQSSKLGLVIISILAIMPFLLTAGTTGEIKGVVTDKETGNPIPGASVQIIGTTMGAMTGPDGRFIIVNVPPGNHDIRVTSISYQTAEITAVCVTEDVATEINIEMEKSMTDLGKVIRVTAEKGAIDMFECPSRVIISGDASKSTKGEKEKDAKIGIPKPIPELTLNYTELYDVDETVSYEGGHDPIYGKNRIKKPRNITRGGCIPPYPPYPPPYPPTYPPHPAHGGTDIVNGQPYDAMFFKDYGTNPFVDTEDDHLSTFAIDVDDASYNMARSYLEKGHLPPDEAIRTEEFINHFDYNYNPSRRGAFSVNAEGGPSIFGENCRLLKIGIQGRVIHAEERKPANLVFVIDVSGSMSGGNRLGLVKRALTTLVDHLEEGDRVGIVVYGSHGRVVLEPTSTWYRKRIIRAIEGLYPGGSTNAEEGLRLGYDMAERMFDKRKINRIILCSDGVANVGQTSPDKLLQWIKSYADRGITLTTVGFGMGNYNDILMEKLGNKGNGMYAYVDDYDGARNVFMKNLTGMLQVIARDVKIQVDFNPEVVRSYRLLGYENRDVADNKFRDDKEDGGEIGAGHQVTALYEVKFNERHSSDRVATVFVRHKNPETNKVKELAGKIYISDFEKRFRSCSDDFKLAACAAEFAEILGHSYWAKNSSLSELRRVAYESCRDFESQEIMDFLDLINRADRLYDQRAER